MHVRANVGGDTMDRDKHLGLKISTEMHYKLHYICNYEGRSANAHIRYLIKNNIDQFEKEHGQIEIDKMFVWR